MKEGREDRASSPLNLKSRVKRCVIEIHEDLRDNNSLGLVFKPHSPHTISPPSSSPLMGLLLQHRVSTGWPNIQLRIYRGLRNMFPNPRTHARCVARGWLLPRENGIIVRDKIIFPLLARRVSRASGKIGKRRRRRYTVITMVMRRRKDARRTAEFVGASARRTSKTSVDLGLLIIEYVRGQSDD